MGFALGRLAGFLKLVCLLFAAAFATSAKAENSVPCLNGMTCLSQGWTDSDRQWWYRTTQGSRLLPLNWMMALEQAGSADKFMSDANMTRLGYLPDPVSPSNPNGLPVGFTVDPANQANPAKSDLMCQTFPTMCADLTMRRDWVGMNCSACHTNDIVIGTARVRVEGAPTLADFQGFEEDLLAALKALESDAGKFSRFSVAVLGADAAASAKADLLIEVAEQVVWQQKLHDKNDAPLVRYGHGRLDAQGHILNKVALTILLPVQPKTILADAPASYPFIWNTSQQKKIQWNGIASNVFRINLPGLGAQTDVGALIRNASEVIGVFAHIETSRGAAWRGYRSSANVTNLIALERHLATLQSPQWPVDLLGPLDAAKVARGDALFDRMGCQGCHDHLEPTDVTKKMAEKMDPIGKQGTDIFLACNTYLHRSKSGNFEGQKIFAYAGDDIAAEDFTRNLLINTTVGTIVGKFDQLLGAIFNDTATTGIGVNGAAPIGVEFLPGIASPAKKAQAKACLNATFTAAQDNILSYKSRSLNGIWATAPYLHNGSVPTLYDLLSASTLRLRSDDPHPLPGAGEPLRPDEFGVGSRKFDPVKVGFITDLADPDNTFRFQVRIPGTKEPIPGNYNSGHDYGTSKLTEQERMDLVEYLKSL